MSSRLRVQVVASIVVLVFAGGIVLSGDDINPGWLRFFGAAVFISLLLLNSWEHFAWRWTVIQRLRSVPTDVSGSWQGTLTSLWRESDGSSLEPKTVFLVVRQTASTASVVLLSNESKSRSSLAKLDRTAHGFELSYLFVGSPAPRHEDESRMHRGAALLDVSGRPAKSLEGRYWTDRETRGELKFSERRREHADSYEAAAALFE